MRHCKFMIYLLTLVLVANLYAQKPRVGIVVWDGHAKEGQSNGTFQLYQIGTVTPGLCAAYERSRDH